MRIASRLKRECRYTIPQLQKLFGANFESALRKALPGSQQPITQPRNRSRVQKAHCTWLERASCQFANRTTHTGSADVPVIVQRRMRGRYRRYKTLDTGEKRRVSVSLPHGHYKWAVRASNGENTVQSQWSRFRH